MGQDMNSSISRSQSCRCKVSVSPSCRQTTDGCGGGRAHVLMWQRYLACDALPPPACAAFPEPEGPASCLCCQLPSALRYRGARLLVFWVVVADQWKIWNGRVEVHRQCPAGRFPMPVSSWFPFRQRRICCFPGAPQGIARNALTADSFSVTSQNVCLGFI